MKRKNQIKVNQGEHLEVEAKSGSSVLVDLWYPREDMPEVRIGLIDVRASDDIKVHYDFDRDGWVVSQMKTSAELDDGPWQEVAFIQAWGLHEEDEGL